MDPVEEFQAQMVENIKKLAGDENVKNLSLYWSTETNKNNYTYNFTWMGRPIIQYPQDIIAVQELIWKLQPDLIIETGIAHGGSLIFSASMLELNAICGGPPDAEVVGIDIDIREHNRKAIEAHPMFRRISMIEGSSIDENVVKKVKEKTTNKHTILLLLDSNHSHQHVLAELNLYSKFVSINSYCVVFDTLIDDMPDNMFIDRPWGKDDNPKTAVKSFLQQHTEFEIDSDIHNKLLITVAPDGYLKRKR